MNTIITSKEAIFEKSREIILNKGISALSIRAVADACNVSIGSIYNYFDSKSDLLSSTIESVWCEIFHSSRDSMVFQDTLSCIQWLYECIEYGHKQYPVFFEFHSLGLIGNENSNENGLMHQTWKHILEGLCAVLKHDPNIRPDAFHEKFTAENFSKLLFSLIFSAILRQDYDPSVVLEMIRRTLY